MGWLRQENAYERRIRELNEESERIRKNMQTIMKGSTTRETSPRSLASDGPRTRSSAMPGQINLPMEEAAYEEQDNGEVIEDQESEGAEAGRSSYNPSEYKRSANPMNAAKPEKLANYLASGSFGKAGSLSRERRIQRNKAIFMLIVAILAIFSLYKMLN